MTHPQPRNITLHWMPITKIEVSAAKGKPVVPEGIPDQRGWYLFFGYHAVYSPYIEAIENGDELWEHAVPLYTGFSTRLRERIDEHLTSTVCTRERVWVTWASLENPMGESIPTLERVEKFLIFHLAPALNSQLVKTNLKRGVPSAIENMRVINHGANEKGHCTGPGVTDTWFPRGDTYRELDPPILNNTLTD